MWFLGASWSSSLTLHVVITDSIPLGSTHGELCLLVYPSRRLVSQGVDDGYALAGVKLGGILNAENSFSSAEQQPAISAAALSEEFLRLLMWGVTMAWEAGETCWE